MNINDQIERYYDGRKWIKVKSYKINDSKSWEERYQDLEQYHIEETTFLIEEIRSLARQLDQASCH